MSRDIPIKGLAELDKFLSALPMNMQKGAYRAGLTAAAAVVRDEARLRAPKKTGAMAKSIKSGSPRQREDGKFSINVRLKGKHGFLGVFHEYGTASHAIASTFKGQGRKALSAAIATGDTSKVIKGPMKINGDFVSGYVIHPGHAAQPFMRPALDAKAEEAVEAFAERLRAYLAQKTGFNAGVLSEAA